MAPRKGTIMSLAHIDAWNVDLPELVEPDDDADERAFAEYAEELALCEAIPAKPYALAYSKHRGFLGRPDFDMRKVFRQVDLIPAERRRASLGPIVWDDWEWARYWLSDDLLNGYIRRCPDLIWKMDKRTGNVFSIRSECNSYRCSQKCAKERVGADLLWACQRFTEHQRIWVAELPDSERVRQRLRQRRSRIGGKPGFLWVRREDSNMLHLYSAVDLKDELTDGRWMEPRAALEHLIAHTMRLPGVETLRWLGGWKRPAAEKKPPRTFDLRSQPRDLMEAALKEAERALREQHGFEQERLTAGQVEVIWLPLVEDANEAQWVQRLATQDEA